MPRCETLRYGALPGQEGDLYLPSRRRASVVVLLHGGFWRQPYGRDQMSAVAADLQRRGHAVWNLEYRRTAGGAGGWPATFDDVRAGVAYLREAPSGAVDLGRVTVCGHSAGGHLALWVAAQRRGLAADAGVTVCAAVGQAPVADLVAAHTLGLGRGAVGELMGAGPDQAPDRYAAASPAALLPLGVRQLILHGVLDDVVPLALTDAYVAAARRAGDSVAVRELAGSGHMEFLDPSSAAHDALCGWLAESSD